VAGRQQQLTALKDVGRSFLLVAEGLDDLLMDSDPLGDLGILEDGLLGLGHLQLALVEGLTLHLPLGLQSGHDVLVLPAHLDTNARLKK
jgi:hypothetical protein